MEVIEVREKLSLFDLTHTISSDMPVYPGDVEPAMQYVATIGKDGFNVTKMTLGSHTGTHVDAPRHFVKNGEAIDSIPLQKLVGDGVVLDLSYKKVGSGITERDLEPFSSLVREGDRVILYTGSSEQWGKQGAERNFTYLEPSGARWLVKRKVCVVGIDCPSIDKFGSEDPVSHRTLLGNSVPLVESLSSETRKLAGRRIHLVCLPLKVAGRDGAPARVIARPMEE